MFSSAVLSTLLSLFVAVSPATAAASLTSMSPTVPAPEILGVEMYSLANRYKVASVNKVFDENILLTLSYLAGQTKVGQAVNWSQVMADSQFQFILQPGKTFAFHDQVLPEYKDSLALTTHADFSSDQGFKSDGYLVGDGVCQFASFINVLANEAGLKVVAPTNHNFAVIPDVDKKNGTAIYYDPNSAGTSQKENLYVTNSLDKPVVFRFVHQGDDLQLSILKLD